MEKTLKTFAVLVALIIGIGIGMSSLSTDNAANGAANRSKQAPSVHSFAVIPTFPAELQFQ